MSGRGRAIAVGLLVAVAVGVNLRFVGPLMDLFPQRAPVPPEAEVSAEPITPEAAGDPLSLPAEAASPSGPGRSSPDTPPAELLRNPFRMAGPDGGGPGVPSALAPEETRLRAIWSQDRRRWVLLGKRILEQGEARDGIRVIEIDAAGAWLGIAGQETYLLLGETAADDPALSGATQSSLSGSKP